MPIDHGFHLSGKDKFSVFKYRIPDVDNVYVYTVNSKQSEGIDLPKVKVPGEFILPVGYRIGVDSMGNSAIFNSRGSMCHLMMGTDFKLHIASPLEITSALGMV